MNAPMTETRQAEVLDFGWEVMKYMKAPTIALWLADDGWDGGVTMLAERVDGKNVAVSLKAWPNLYIQPDNNPN